jgi:protein phosphatase
VNTTGSEESGQQAESKEDVETMADSTKARREENDTERDRSGTPTQPAQEEKTTIETRPLTGVPTVEVPGEPRLEVESRCHVGAVRGRNEDASYTFVAQAGGSEPLPMFGLFIVADGMGGHDEGHTASRLVSRTVAQYILENLYQPMLGEGHGTAEQTVQEVIEQSVLVSNRSLATLGGDKEMGTTLTVALILGRRLFLAHVGDSRAYLLQDGDLSVVTTDHSIVQVLQDSGQITVEEAASHPKRNLLYRALMGEKIDSVDAYSRPLPPKGLLMLCSDGLWGLVPQPRLATILAREVPLQARADLLLEEALEAGGDDNVTVILVTFEL